jgi:hypothetical protein
MVRCRCGREIRHAALERHVVTPGRGEPGLSTPIGVITWCPSCGLACVPEPVTQYRDYPRPLGPML